VADPTEELDVVGEDWYARDLGDAAFVRCRFVDVDMTELATAGARFEECTFTGVRLNASRHTGSALVNCRLHRCTLFGASLTGCKLTGTSFTDTVLSPLVVEGGSWAFTSLRGAVLEGSRLSGVDLREADLAHLAGKGLVLTACDLSGADLTGARLPGADLRGSLLGDLDPRVVELRGALVDVAQALHLVGTLGLEVR
jgi:uncharacterized protein YjbI with pentapeptide repeats